MAERPATQVAIGPKVPRATLRALRAIAAHPSVRGIDASFDEPRARTAATIRIDTDLPSRWLARGHSDNGVLAVEPVSFTFGDGFPLLAPEIHFRSDFDRSHPHLQPRGPHFPPEPCLVLGSATELMRSRGILGLIDQLADWLRKAAMVQLIDPEHGWEPTRRDHVQDHASADFDLLRKRPQRDAGAAVFETVYFAMPTPAGSHAFAVQVSERRTTLSPADFGLRFAKARKGDVYKGNGVALIAWPDKAAISGRYSPEDVEDLPSLRAKARDFGCADNLEALLRLVSARLAGERLPLVAPLLVVLMVRRPCNLIGTSSPIELLPYVIELRGADDLSRTSKAAVRLAAMEEAMSTDLLRRASGDRPADGRLPWTLIGCGSVGSKIALHMARAGRGPSIVVDRGTMRPHNYARHALIPLPISDGMDYGTKACALAEALTGMRQEPKVGNFDVVEGLLAKGAAAATGPADAFAILNATAAASVREALSLPEIARSRARIVEACLFGAGRVGYMSVEGPGANPSTNDLVAEAYRLFADDPKIREVVFNAEAELVAIGQGCSSATFPMPDAQLSVFAATMSEELARKHSQGLPDEGGELLFGTRAEDGIGLIWHRHPQASCVLVEGGSTAPRVRISSRVDGLIREAVAARPGRETGGVLIGRFSDVTETFHVVDVLPPPPDSRFSASEFVLGTQGLKDRIAEVLSHSGGSLFALGTWHNHLVTSGPSSTDVRTALELAAAQAQPVLMLIHTPGGYRYLTAEASAGSGTWIDPSAREEGSA